MAFFQGELVACSFYRWSILLLGRGAAGTWRGLVLSPGGPAEVTIADGDENITVFGANTVVATPTGKPAPNALVTVQASPIAFISGAPVATFPLTIPVEGIFQILFYVNVAGFAVYAVLQNQDGCVLLALPDELTQARAP